MYTLYMCLFKKNIYIYIHFKLLINNICLAVITKKELNIFEFKQKIFQIKVSFFF